MIVDDRLHNVAHIGGRIRVEYYGRIVHKNGKPDDPELGCPLDADPLESLLIRLFDGTQWEVLIDFQALFALVAGD
jgi:hypothetical protein